MKPIIPVLERDLLLRLRDGDYVAFDQLYSQYSNRIYGKLLKFTKSAETAEELLQELFMKVWEKREAINADLPFKSYLFRIAEHLISDFYRRAAKDRELYDHLLRAGITYEQAVDAERPDQVQQRQIEKLEGAIASLPQKCREVYVLCKIEGKSYQDAASQLGVSTSTISNHMTKANQIIRAYLAQPATALLLLHYCVN